MTKPIGIMACARSGTHWITAVLGQFRARIVVRTGTEARLGPDQPKFDVGHERLGRHGICSHALLQQHADSTTAIPDEIWSDLLLIHQVRHPLTQISSALQLPDMFWRWTGQYLAPPADGGELARVMQYWLTWNQWCRRNAVAGYRVEHAAEEFPDAALDALRLQRKAWRRAVADTPPTNQWSVTRDVTYADLVATDKRMAEQIREEAGRYKWNI
jgi:hypothetical protein